MAVDPQARAKLAESTRWLVGARITNDQFEDSIPVSADPAIREIYNQFLWLLYSDLREYRLDGVDKLAPAHRDVAARCILFLKSGLPYSWPVLSRANSAFLTLSNIFTLGVARRKYFQRLATAGDMAYWPFVSASQHAAALGSPVYLSGAGANNSLEPNALRSTNHMAG